MSWGKDIGKGLDGIIKLAFGGVIVSVILIAVLIGLGVNAVINPNEYQIKAEEAVAQCEAELPRNQTCEVIISAKPKK